VIGSGGVGPITRKGARAAARHELSKGIYHRDDPPWPLRVFNAIQRWLDRFFHTLSKHSPGGGIGALLLIAAVVALIAITWWRLGAVRRNRHVPGAVLVDTPATADDHLRDALRAAAEGRWHDAVVARMRALALALEDAGVVDRRPGRTASELAREVAGAEPAAGPAMRAAATTFDAVAYGNRDATREMYDVVVAASVAARVGGDRRSLVGVRR